MKNTLLFVLALLWMSTLQAQQTIRGQVIDEASKAPLPGVNIVLMGTDPPVGTSTDGNGYFKLQNVPLGRQSLKFSFIGYEDRTLTDLIVTAGKEVVLTVSMTESVEMLETVDVVYDRSADKDQSVNEMTIVGARSFNLEETRKYAGSLGDPSRMAANFAGVVAGNDSRNDIVVRGNSPSGMLWQMEGLNIPNPNHFGALNSTGGPVSMINNNNLDKSDFLTSAFPAQYGNALAGVFDLHLRKGNTEKHEFLGQIGFNGFEFGAEGPLGKKKKSSYLLNYRYSTLGVFQQMGINFGTGTATPLYQDINYKFYFPVGKKGQLTFFGINGNSSVNFLGNDVDTTQIDLYGDENSNTRVRYATYINGLSFNHQLSLKTNLRLVAGHSRTYERFKGDSISIITREEFPSGEAQFDTDKFSAHFIVNHKLNARNTIVGGVMTDYVKFGLFNKVVLGGVTDVVRVDTDDDYLLGQTYVQWKHRFNKGFSLVGGIHSQLLNISNSISAEPRLALRWNFRKGMALSAGYGYHAQMQSVYTYFVQTNTTDGVMQTNKSLGFSNSHHIVLTHDWNVTPYLRIKTELYNQQLFNVPIERNASSFSALNSGADFAPSNNDSLINEGTGRNYGLELTIERFFNKGYYFLITTSIFDSKYKGSDGLERNTAFNTGYVLNVLGGKEFKLKGKGNVLALNIKTSFVGGRYLTPLNDTLSRLYGVAVYDNDRAFSEKQSDYFRTDIKISYRKNLKKSTMEFSIDLQNVSNHKNVFRQSFNPRTGMMVTQYQQGFFPVPMFRWTF